MNVNVAYFSPRNTRKQTGLLYIYTDQNTICPARDGLSFPGIFGPSTLYSDSAERNYKKTAV